MSISKTSKLLNYINYREYGLMCRALQGCKAVASIFTNSCSKLTETAWCRNASNSVGWSTDGGQVTVTFAQGL